MGQVQNIQIRILSNQAKQVTLQSEGAKDSFEMECNQSGGARPQPTTDSRPQGPPVRGKADLANPAKSVANAQVVVVQV